MLRAWSVLCTSPSLYLLPLNLIVQNSAVKCSAVRYDVVKIRNKNYEDLYMALIARPSVKPLIKLAWFSKNLWVKEPPA